MAKKFRVSFKCPDCDNLHVFVTERPKALQIADDALRDGAKQVLIEDEATAMMADIERADAEADNPFLALVRDLESQGFAFHTIGGFPP